MSDKKEEKENVDEEVNSESEEKPDDPKIDCWKIEGFKPGDMKSPLLEESSFATLFPRYREKYIKDVWPIVTRELKKFGITCVLDLIEGSMTVKTTRKTWDPFAIMKARDLIKLLSRSVPINQAMKIMQDEVMMDVIKIGNIVSSKEKFVKRRQRLIGPNGSTLKAIELLTNSYIMVQGNTVSVMGNHKSLNQVRKLVLDCMNNIHPIYNIKSLMIKRELMKDPDMAKENWDRFIPKFRKQNIQRKTKKVVKYKKKEKSLFPPAPTPRKEDLQMETGEYWQSERKRDIDRRKKRQDAQAEKMKETKVEKNKVYQPPKENIPKKVEATEDISKSISNIKENTRKRKRENNEKLDDYVVSKKKKTK